MAKRGRKKYILLISEDNSYMPAIEQGLKDEYKAVLENGTKIKDLKLYSPYLVILDSTCSHLARYLKKRIPIIYLSPAKVFSGRGELGYTSRDIPDADNDEGKELIKKEKEVVERKNVIILRHSNIYTLYTLERLKERIITEEKARINSKNKDYYIFYKDFVALLKQIIEMIKDLLENRPSLIIHVRGAERLSKYDMALQIAQFFNLPTTNIVRAYNMPGGEITPKLLGLVANTPFTKALKITYHKN